MTAAEHPFGHLARQANKLMDQMQKGFYVQSGVTWTPSVNLYETAGTYLVCVDLAGVDKEKIDVEVVDQSLTLRGARAVPNYEEPPGPDAPSPRPPVEGGHAGEPAGHAGPEGQAGHPAHADSADPHARPGGRVRIHLMEIDHGPFAREVELPPDADKKRISASYHNGMLWIEIPKT